MKKCRALIATIVLAAPLMAAQSAIDPLSVANAASYLKPGLPNSGVAQGSMFVVKGSNLGTCPTSLGTVPLPLTLNGTHVRIAVGAVSVDAPIVYVYCPDDAEGATQVAAIAPSATPLGTGTVTVNGATAPIEIVKSAFGIFTVNTAGSGPAVVQNFVSPGSTPVNLLNEAAHPGQAVILWGTGLGAIAGDDAAHPPVGPVGDVEVLVGGKRATVFYHGRSPEFPGIDQINFYVPESVEGCYVPLAVIATDGSQRSVSNFGSLAITATESDCSDPAGFTAEDIAKLDTGGLNLGEVILSRRTLDWGVTGVEAVTTDTGAADFNRFTPVEMVAAQSPFGAMPAGTCTVFTYTGGQPLIEDPAKPAGADAGARLTVAGRNSQKELLANPSVAGAYSGALGGGSNPFGPSLPLFLNTGAYTVTGTGGPDTGAFGVTVNIPEALRWTNRDAAGNISRSQGLTVTWSGAATNSSVIIAGSSATVNQIGAGFLCTERAEAGQFTVPPEVLTALPPSAVVNNLSTGLLEVKGAGQPVRFNASGCDVCLANYVVAEAKVVSYQ